MIVYIYEFMFLHFQYLDTRSYMKYIALMGFELGAFSYRWPQANPKQDGAFCQVAIAS